MLIVLNVGETSAILFQPVRRDAKRNGTVSQKTQSRIEAVADIISVTPNRISIQIQVLHIWRNSSRSKNWFVFHVDRKGAYRRARKLKRLLQKIQTEQSDKNTPTFDPKKGPNCKSEAG